MMSLLDSLSSKNVWEDFYSYKSSLACPKDALKRLRSFIDGEKYIKICDSVAECEPFPFPRKKTISKMSSSKKRTVYVYPEDENTVLKLLTYLLIRKYDVFFAEGLYSFRPGVTAKDAVRHLRRSPDIDRMYAYKVDVSDYFNSVDIDLFLPMLKDTLADDPCLFEFLSSLLTEDRVIDEGETVCEKKGIMAGTPLSSFYANLYLSGLDKLFCDSTISYARYSDDIIVFAETEEKVKEYAEKIKNYLNDMHLTVNPSKEEFFTPDTGWTFLGFFFKGGITDISEVSFLKIKGKMRRKTRALDRWKKRNGLDGEKAAKAFIRIFNKKLLDSPVDNELSWSYWYFSVINTTETLRLIDEYAQDCIRYLVSGKRTKARYNVRYSYIKELGYRSLVNAYYSFDKN